MRHLKLFESFEKLYTEISSDQFDDTGSRKDIDFDTKLIKQLEDRINEDWTLQVENSSNNHIKHLSISRSDEIVITIWETTDEWFMVEHMIMPYEFDEIQLDDQDQETALHYYECDTFEGLLQLLKYYDVIK